MSKDQKDIGHVLSDERRKQMQERLVVVRTKLEKYRRVIDALSLEAELLQFRLG